MPKPNLSVCILAKNEEKYIGKTLESVKAIADEIVVVIDDQTTDKTPEIVKKFTDKVFTAKHKDNFHKNKQFALEKATNQWTLWMDADEEITPELRQEISKTLEENTTFDGFKIPRKNIIFGKWIEHSGWYPDHQVRLFRRTQTHFPAKSIHEHPEVKGEVGELKEHIIHYNYDSISQFLTKLDLYTKNDAIKLNQKINKVTPEMYLLMPIDEFIKRYLVWKGYKDGVHGLALSILQAFYTFVVVLKVWEMHKFEPQKIKHPKKFVEKSGKEFSKLWNWWRIEQKISQAKSPIKRKLLKVKRKIKI